MIIYCPHHYATSSCATRHATPICESIKWKASFFSSSLLRLAFNFAPAPRQACGPAAKVFFLLPQRLLFLFLRRRRRQTSD
uniref:Uncharacterized protein n=1 Tax=Caenorhabditis japonica TaxID=281687 RepID=A0A8R1EDC1_CAEJA